MRVGIALLVLLEDDILSMDLENLLQDFKSMVKQLDPYRVIEQTLSISLSSTEDCLDILQYRVIDKKKRAIDPNAYTRHRTLGPKLKGAIKTGDMATVAEVWKTLERPDRNYIADEVRVMLYCR